MKSDDFAHEIRSLITDDVTHDIPYYRPEGEIVTNVGTAHISVLAADGSAVAITSSLNLL